MPHVRLATTPIKTYELPGNNEPYLNAGVFDVTNPPRWFLVQIKEIVDFEEELADAQMTAKT